MTESLDGPLDGPREPTGGKDRPAIEFLAGEFVVRRLDDGQALPDLSALPAPWALVRTDEATTLVSRAGHPATPGDPAETAAGWSAFRVEGPLDFSLTGVLAGISAVLADAGISIFAFSCWETDYVLVRRDRRDHARAALAAAGYPVEGG